MKKFFFFLSSLSYRGAIRCDTALDSAARVPPKAEKQASEERKKQQPNADDCLGNVGLCRLSGRTLAE